LALVSVGVVTVVGCSNVLTVPIPFDTGAALGAFTVTSGQPSQKTTSFTLNDVGIEAGGGNLQVPLDAITITPANNGGGKLRPTQQDVNLCLTACAAAGVDAETCSQVCEENQLLITVRVSADTATVCDDGEEYQAIVTLDDNGNPTAVEVTPSTLSESTVELLNHGTALALCVVVLSPISGEILIDEMIFNVGL
jgi:hypothetical protein